MKVKCNSKVSRTEKVMVETEECGIEFLKKKANHSRK